MKPVLRNYYTALLFEGRPDLHMTLQYYRQKDPWDLAQLIINMDKKMLKCFPVQWHLILQNEGWFGYDHTIRTLVQGGEFCVPTCIRKLTLKQWRPHITCKDKSLDLVVEAVAIMHKDVEIVRWEFEEN